LGFEGIATHAMDAVSDRDFAVEFLATGALLQMHLSRLAEELILWSSSEFGFIRLDDAYCTGSSIMPQKRNPDMAELIRGKSGRIYGNLLNLLTTLKALPLAYNKDLQEDKAPVMDTAEQLKMALELMARMLATATFNTENMLRAVKTGFLNATDLADYLVKLGIPFRSAHEISGKAVKWAEANGTDLEGITLGKYQELLEVVFTTKKVVLDQTLYEAIDPWQSMNQKESSGSTAVLAVKQMIEANDQWLIQTTKNNIK
jgi:argininosuccinate lyase